MSTKVSYSRSIANEENILFYLTLLLGACILLKLNRLRSSEGKGHSVTILHQGQMKM